MQRSYSDRFKLKAKLPADFPPAYDLNNYCILLIDNVSLKLLKNNLFPLLIKPVDYEVFSVPTVTNNEANHNALTAVPKGLLQPRLDIYSGYQRL